MDQRVIDRYLKARAIADAPEAPAGERAAALAFCGRLEAQYPGVGAVALAQVARAQKPPPAQTARPSTRGFTGARPVWADGINRVAEFMRAAVDEARAHHALSEIVDQVVVETKLTRAGAVQIRLTVDTDTLDEIVELGPVAYAQFLQLFGSRASAALVDELVETATDE